MKAKSVIRAAVALLCFEAALTIAFAQTTQAPAILVVPQNLDPTQQSLTINFHNQLKSTTSPAQTITLWNVSSTTVTGLSAQVTAGKFTISSSNWSTCLPANCLGPGQHATIQVTFVTTSALGASSSTLSFTSSTPGLIRIPSVTLIGTSVPPPSSGVPFSVNPAYTFHGLPILNGGAAETDSNVYFGNQSFGVTTCAAKVYISNGSTMTPSVTATLTPVTGSGFAISVSPNPASVPPGVNTASLGVSYTPMSANDSATLNVKFGGVTTRSISLFGSGVTTNPTAHNIPFIDMGNTTPQNGYLGAYTGGLFDGNFGPSGDTGCNSPTSYVNTTTNPTNPTSAPQDTIGRAFAALMQPINSSGQYDSVNGKVVLLSIGMSNASDEWCGAGSDMNNNGADNLCGSPGYTLTPSIYSFMQEANTQNGQGIITLNPYLVIVNGAISSQEACDYTFWSTTQLPPPPTCSGIPTGKQGTARVDYDAILTDQLTPHLPQQLYESQVQAIWLKEADVAIVNQHILTSLACGAVACADAYNLESNLGKIVRAAKHRYPNLRMVFLTSRSYGGFTGFLPTSTPYDYEGGFANKWLVKAQIDQMNNGGTAVDNNGGDLNYLVCTPTTNCTTAAPEAPFVIWDRLPGTNPNNVLAGSTYIWAYTNPSSPYTYDPNSDGAIWPFDGNKNMATCTPPATNNYFSDGQHPNDCGINQVGGTLLLNYFLSSPYTNPWFTTH